MKFDSRSKLNFAVFRKEILGSSKWNFLK